MRIEKESRTLKRTLLSSYTLPKYIFSENMQHSPFSWSVSNTLLVIYRNKSSFLKVLIKASLN